MTDQSLRAVRVDHKDVLSQPPNSFLHDIATEKSSVYIAEFSTQKSYESVSPSQQEQHVIPAAL